MAAARAQGGHHLSSHKLCPENQLPGSGRPMLTSSVAYHYKLHIIIDSVFCFELKCAVRSASDVCAAGMLCLQLCYSPIRYDIRIGMYVKPWPDPSDSQ